MSATDTSMAGYYGVNYCSPKTGTTELGTRTNIINVEDSGKSMKRIAKHGFTLVRLPFNHESYFVNRQNVITEIASVLKSAEAVGLKVILDLHQYEGGSYIYNDVWHGGFHSAWLSTITQGGDDLSRDAFWPEFWNNNLFYKGVSIWESIREIFRDLVNRFDAFPSLLGYELINEPRLYATTDYAKLGNYHSYLTDAIRGWGSTKKIFFNRAYWHLDTGSTDETNSPSIAPTNKTNTVFAPHRYSAVFNGIFSKFVTLANNWGVPVMMGEWANELSADKNNYMAELKLRNFGWTYWAWQPIQSTLDSQELVDTTANGYADTIHLTELVAAKNTNYP